MKRKGLVTIGGLLLSSGLAGVVFAQSPAQQPAPTRGSSTPQVTMTPPKTAGGYTATFTGCVERATQQAAVSATAEGAKADNGFVLTHALRGTADNIPAAIGTSARASEASKETTYKLDAAVPTLASQLGHQVEVTGLVTVVMGGNAVATPDGALASLGGTPQVTVEKIRSISETCGRPSP
jgi:hypothetical protein